MTAPEAPTSGVAVAPPPAPRRRIEWRFRLEQDDPKATLIKVVRAVAFGPDKIEYLAGPNRFAIAAEHARQMAARGDVEILPSTRCRVLAAGRTRCRGGLDRDAVGLFITIATDEVEDLVKAGIVEVVAGCDLATGDER